MVGPGGRKDVNGLREIQGCLVDQVEGVWVGM